MVANSIEAGYAADPTPAGDAPPLELENIRFRYSPQGPWVFDDFSLTIAGGECVGLLGPAGCGKSTLIKLILGFREPLEGRVWIAGVQRQHLERRALWDLTAVVLQGDPIFSGSIAENIGFFAGALDPGRIRGAARLARLHEEIEALPRGYHTLVGDLGTMLSPGQQQRLVLARALYRRPRLLILDEATDHLDEQDAQHIHRTLARMSITRVFLSQRRVALGEVDRIIRLPCP